jgi:hypothetical protein
MGGSGESMRIRVMAVTTVLAVAVGATGCAVAVPGAPAAATGPAPAASSADPTTAAQAPPPRSRGALYRDAEGRFELNPPPYWGVDDTGKLGPVVIFFDTAENPETSEGSGATINVVVVPATGDWPGTIDQNRQAVKVFQDYRSITDESVTLSDGSAAHMFGYTFKAPNGETKRNIQLMAVNGGSELVVVTGQTLPHDWDLYGELFEATLRSLVVAT